MGYTIKSIEGELKEYAFDFGGVVALRNFTARTNGNRLIIESAENANFTILDALVNEVEIDGIIYDNVFDAQKALQRLVFSPTVPKILTEKERETIASFKTIIQDAQVHGAKTYQTKAELFAVTPVPGDGIAAKVANDANERNNGYYAVVDGAWVQDKKMVAQEVEENNTDKGVSGKAVVDFANQRLGSGFFTLKNSRIIGNGNEVSSPVGFNATDFLPIAGSEHLSIKGYEVYFEGEDVRCTVPVAFYDADKNFISFLRNNISGVSEVEVSSDQIPNNAKYIRCSEYAPNGKGSIIGLSVSSLLKGFSYRDSQMHKLKVVFTSDTFYIRTCLSDNEDIITTYRYGIDNGNITPDKTYKGDNTQSDEDILAGSWLHELWDSTAPIWISDFWYLFAQHGYVVPVITCVHDKTSEDIGSQWHDNINRTYTLGKIDGNTLYFLPEITTNANGTITREWHSRYSNDAISSFSHASGAANIADISNITKKSAYQIKPIQKSLNRKFLADGKEVGVGVHYCDEFVTSETLSCLNPAKVTQWFPSIEHEATDYEMCQITQSFVVSGLSTKVNTLINVKHPVDFNYYAANQCRTLVPVNGEESYAIIPKVIKSNANKQFNTSDYHNNPTLVIERNSIDLVNENELPDRLITWLEKNGQGVLGFATGLDLRRGATTNENRLNTVPIGRQALYFSPSNRNKFYVRVLNGEAFNNTLPTSFIGEINYYYSYFSPKQQEAKVYHVKDGNTHLIYIHHNQASDKLEIKIPDECEGLPFEIVEKTAGAKLLTEVAQNGKLYASFTDDANYLVLKSN